MALTNSERVRRWQDRVRLKSDFFAELERRRRQELSAPHDLDDTPEGRAVKSFFLAYPRCFTLPESVDFGACEGALSAVVDERVYTEDEIAAVLVALSEISSVPVLVSACGDGSSAMWTRDDLPELQDRVRREVSEMRRLGLWSAA